MKKEFDVKDTESYKAGYNDFMTGQSFTNRYIWAANAHTFNNWLDGWNDAACWSAGIERTVNKEQS